MTWLLQVEDIRVHGERRGGLGGFMYSDGDRWGLGRRKSLLATQHMGSLEPGSEGSSILKALQGMLILH